MSCSNPIGFWRNSEGLAWSRSPERFGSKYQIVGCGRCRSCRIRKRLDWAVRCALEAQDHDSGSVITLTYAPENLPPQGGLAPDDLKDFLKRLRQKLARLDGRAIRFFAVGEYGSKGPGHHPHFHIMVFGFDFPDREFLKRSRKGTRLFRSDFLDRAWRKGHAWIDPGLSWKAAQYVAGYCMKKINGEAAEDHYKGLEKEFIRTSLKPGIGRPYFDRNFRAIYERGFISFPDDSREFYIPKKFDQWLKATDSDLFASVSVERKRRREVAAVAALQSKAGSHEPPFDVGGSDA